MSKYLREMVGYRRSLQQHVTFSELLREYPQLQPPRQQAIVPNPWDVEPWRQSTRCWKDYRTAQYRIPAPPRLTVRRPKITWDTPWLPHRRRLWFQVVDGPLCPFRVRFAYRRHRLVE